MAIPAWTNGGSTLAGVESGAGVADARTGRFPIHSSNPHRPPLMAQRQKPIVGLDIDPAGIAVARVSVNDGLKLEQAFTASLEPGIVRDGEVVDVPALSEVLKSVWSDHKGLDRRVRIGVANQKVVVRTIELPIGAEGKELDAAVRFQAQDALPMPLDQAVLDWQTLAVTETENGPRQRVLIAAARRDMIEPVVAAARGAGLRVEGIDLAAFAMIRALRTDWSRRGRRRGPLRRARRHHEHRRRTGAAVPLRAVLRQWRRRPRRRARRAPRPDARALARLAAARRDRHAAGADRRRRRDRRRRTRSPAGRRPADLQRDPPVTRLPSHAVQRCARRARHRHGPRARDPRLRRGRRSRDRPRGHARRGSPVRSPACTTPK